MNEARMIAESWKAPTGRRTKSWTAAIIYFVLILYGITALLPLLWLVGSAFKSVEDFNFPNRFIPHHPTLENFTNAFSLLPFARFFLNSLKICTIVTLGTVATSAMAAYAFARLKFPGRDTIFIAYLGTMMVPWAVVMIPTFILIKTLGWMDTHLALIVPAMFSAYGTFMLRQFFLGIAREYEEAALIDGCGYWRVFWHVVMPLSVPALATLGVFTFIGTWNDLIMPLIFISSEDKMTIALGMNQFKNMRGDADWGALMAGALVMLLPMLILFSIGQRFFSRGIRLSVEKT